MGEDRPPRYSKYSRTRQILCDEIDCCKSLQTTATVSLPVHNQWSFCGCFFFFLWTPPLLPLDWMSVSFRLTQSSISSGLNRLILSIKWFYSFFVIAQIRDPPPPPPIMLQIHFYFRLLCLQPLHFTSQTLLCLHVLGIGFLFLKKGGKKR